MRRFILTNTQNLAELVEILRITRNGSRVNICIAPLIKIIFPSYLTIYGIVANYISLS